METVLEQVCASCGNSRLPDGSFCLFCGDVLTEPFGKNPQHDRPTPPGPSREPLPYAGFWLRVWAGAIDVAVEVAGALLLTVTFEGVLNRFRNLLGLSRYESKYAVGMAFIVILAVGSWLYCAFAESSSWRATIGKRLLGLQVMTAEGDRTSFGQATVRHLMKFLSFFCLNIGFMMAGWTKRRQALHDIPCDCVVVRVRPPQRPFSLLSH